MSARVDSSDAVHYEIFCKKHAPYQKREQRGAREEKTSKYEAEGSFKSAMHRAHAVTDSVNINSEGSDIEEFSCKDSPVVLLTSPYDGLQDTAEKTRGLGGFGTRTGAPKRKR
jgi:hypothetical protein